MMINKAMEENQYHFRKCVASQIAASNKNQSEVPAEPACVYPVASEIVPRRILNINATMVMVLF